LLIKMDTRRNRIKGVVNIPKQRRPSPPPAPVFGVDRLLSITPIISLPSMSTVQQQPLQKLPVSTTTQTLAPANQSTSSPSYFSQFHHPPIRSPIRQSLLNPLSSLATDHSVNTNSSSSSSILGNSHLLRQTLSTPPRTMSNYHVLKNQLKYHHHHQTHAPVDKNKLTMLHFALMNPEPGPS
jgi:hypothetical protein